MPWFLITTDISNLKITSYEILFKTLVRGTTHYPTQDYSCNMKFAIVQHTTFLPCTEQSLEFD